MSIDLDVLIIGGGAQGLWMLNHLNERNYRAILLERRELGGGQTCHSHGLIHRGHYYDDVDMMIVLNASAQFWEAFTSRHGIAKLNPEKAIAGFGPGTAVHLHKYLWETAGLRFNKLTKTLPILEGGFAVHLYETEEFSLDTSQVVSCLARDVAHCIYQLEDSDDALSFTVENSSITSVRARVDGTSHELRPGFVILCAGESNLNVLEALGTHRNRTNPDVLVQARRKSHMLVLRSAELPLLTAVFPIRGGLQGVFICSRIDAETGKTVWLVSDHNSMPFNPGLGEDGEMDPSPSRSWINKALISLKATAPKVLACTDLELSVYTGLTAERNFGLGKHMTDCYIDPLGMENLLTIWPTKLTLTPFASNIALRFIRPFVPEGSGVWPQVERPIDSQGCQISREMWERQSFVGATAARTAWWDHNAFLRHWDLKHAA